MKTAGRRVPPRVATGDPPSRLPANPGGGIFTLVNGFWIASRCVDETPDVPLCEALKPVSTPVPGRGEILCTMLRGGRQPDLRSRVRSRCCTGGEMREGHEAGSAHGVWIVNQYASAPDRAAGTRHYDLARALVQRGWDVTVFAAGVSHMTGREERLRGAGLCRSQVFDGVRFVWLRTFPYHGNTWRRQVNMLSYLVAFLVVQTRSRRPGVVIGSTVHPFAAFGGWLAARLRGATFAFEIRDLWPQTLVDLGALQPGSPGERLLRGLEAFLVRRATVVITLIPGIRDYLVEHHLPADHVVYIPNGVDLAEFDARMEEAIDGTPAACRCLGEIRRMRAAGRFVFAYAGTFGRVNRLDTVIRAAAIADQARPGRIGLILVGDGPERAELEQLARAEPSVAVMPAVPKTVIPALLHRVDATVVHATRTPVYRYGISFNKLFEYMAAGRPVLFACQSAYDPVAVAKAGIVVQPDDPAELARAMLELAAAPADERTAMALAGRNFVAQEHDMARLGERFADVVASAVPRGTLPAAHGR